MNDDGFLNLLKTNSEFCISQIINLETMTAEWCELCENNFFCVCVFKVHKTSILICFCSGLRNHMSPSASEFESNVGIHNFSLAFALLTLTERILI